MSSWRQLRRTNARLSRKRHFCRRNGCRSTRRGQRRQTQENCAPAFNGPNPPCTTHIHVGAGAACRRRNFASARRAAGSKPPGAGLSETSAATPRRHPQHPKTPDGRMPARSVRISGDWTDTVHSRNAASPVTHAYRRYATRAPTPPTHQQHTGTRSATRAHTSIIAHHLFVV